MSNVRKTLIANCQKKFLIKTLSEYTRLDGRSFDEFRNIKIEFGKEWGSCYVSLGKTRVLAQVSCEVQAPKSSRPSEGILNLNIELNPIAAPHFDSSRQSDLYVQLNRLLEKCLKDSKAVDLESLCIKMNEKVWALRIDVNVLNHEGNILDCASVAALAAVAHFRRPDVTCDGEEFIIHSAKQRDPIPMVIQHYPVCVTYSIFDGGNVIVADPNLLEEGVADGFLCICLNAYKELCGLHLGGKVDLSTDVILSTANKAATRAGIVVEYIKETIRENSEKRENREDTSFHRLVEESIEQPLNILNVCGMNQWSLKETRKKKAKKNQNAAPAPAATSQVEENQTVVDITEDDSESEESVTVINTDDNE